MWSESHELFGTSDEDDAAQPKKEDECEVYEPDAEAGVEEQVAEETRDAVACLPECTPSDSEQEESSEDDDTKTNNKKTSPKSNSSPNSNSDIENDSSDDAVEQVVKRLKSSQPASLWDRDAIDVWNKNQYVSQKFDISYINDASSAISRYNVNNPVYFDLDHHDYVSDQPSTQLTADKWQVEVFLAVEWEGFRKGEPFPQESRALCRVCLGEITKRPCNPLGVPLGLPVSQRLDDPRTRYMERYDPKTLHMNNKKRTTGLLPRHEYNCLPVFCSPPCVRTFNNLYVDSCDKGTRWHWFCLIARTLQIPPQYLSERMSWALPRELNPTVIAKRNADLDRLSATEMELELEPRNIRYQYVPLMYVSQERIMRTATYYTTQHKIKVLRDQMQLNSHVSDIHQISPADIKTKAIDPLPAVPRKKQPRNPAYARGPQNAYNKLRRYY